MSTWQRVLFLLVWVALGFNPAPSARPVTRLASLPAYQFSLPARDHLAVCRSASLTPVHATFRIGRHQSGTPPELSVTGGTSLNLCLPTAGGVLAVPGFCSAPSSARLGLALFSRALRAPPFLS